MPPEPRMTPDEKAKALELIATLRARADRYVPDTKAKTAGYLTALARTMGVAASVEYANGEFVVNGTPSGDNAQAVVEWIKAQPPVRKGGGRVDDTTPPAKPTAGVTRRKSDTENGGV